MTDGTKYNEAVAAGAVTLETSGTWYLLLPEHFEPNTSTIQMRSGDRVTDVKVTENFRNSGRTLVMVKATLTPDPRDFRDYIKGESGYYYTDRPQITMDMYLPWSEYDKVRDGYAVYHAAFESGNPGRLGNLTDSDYYQTVGYPDVWPGTPNTYLGSNTVANSQIRRWMSDLDPDSDEERFVYLRALENIRDADLSEQVEFRKDARADQGDTWGRGTRDENQVTVTEGGKYTYRLTVASKQDAKTMGILIYDAVEEYMPHEGYDQDDVNRKKAWSGAWQGKGQWKGTLESVDLSELYRDGCMGRLYYSTTPGLVFDNNIDTNVRGWVNFDSGAWGSAYRLTDTTIWTEVTGSLVENEWVWTVPDMLKGKVTAIAVNGERYNQADIAASYALDAGEKVSVYLNMAAPTDGGNDGTWNAKGAYDHKKDNASSTDDIDWTGAADPANNMYAYNAATMVFIPFVKSGNSEDAQPRARLESAYSRVGIVPGVVSVRKTWNDGERVNGQYMEDRDGLRPDSVTVHLKGRTSDPDSPKIDRDLTLTAEGGWKGVFLNAPDTDDSGNPYTYTVTEDPVPGYTTGVYREAGRSWEIVNTHEKETFTLRGEKLWLNPDGTPAEPTVNIRIAYRRITSTGPENGSHSIQVTPDSAGRWIYAFKDLERYEPGGFEYQYVLEESSVPDGWFAQTGAVPAGVTVTAEYDPEDLTTFRNFRKPDFGYGMIYCKVNGQSRPKDGNTAVPSFTFTVDMTKDGATVGGEYEYVLYDKAPGNSWSTDLPEGTAQIGSGTIRSGDTVTVQPEQTVVIIGIPGGTECTVKEGMGAGWTSDHDYANDTSRMTIEQGRTSSCSFWNYYAARTTLTIAGTKRLRGREQKAKEFAFNLSDYNEFDDTGYENSGYGSVIATVKTGESRGTVTEGDGTKTGLAMFTFRATYDGNSTYTMREYGGTKVLHYKVEEALPAGTQVNADRSVTWKNVTYDTDRKDVTVTITDNMDGTLKITTTPLVFTNTYRLQKKIALTAHKELVGRTLQPDEFSFEVRRSGAAAGSAPIARGKNDGEGNVTFTPEIALTERDLASISPATGIGEVKFLISEVQGTDPTVAYMTTPAEAVVQIGLTADGEVLAALPGQALTYQQTDCETCGGSGEVGGLTVALLKANSANSGLENAGSVRLAESFNSQYMDICPDCGGTGYNLSGTPCGTCSGEGISLRTEYGMETLHTAEGKVFVAMYGNMPLDELCSFIRVDVSQFPSASYWGMLGYIFTEEQWTAANGDTNVLEGMADTAAILYLAKGNGECAVCHGTGKVNGEPCIVGDAEPVSLVNRLKTGIRFTTEKLLDGQPAEEPFEFVLAETDELRRTETEIARTMNSADGKILFDTGIDPEPAGDRFYVIREAAGTDTGITYDIHEELYRVTVGRNPDGSVSVETKHLGGDGVFRNERKQTGKGSLAIEVSAGGYQPHFFFIKPVFTVNVTLKDSSGKPLAGQPLPDITEGMQLLAVTRSAGPVTDENGRGTIRIIGGGTVEITGLPDGTVYTAEQPAESMPAGFVQSSAEGTSGTIRAGQQSKASFANEYQPDEPTGEPDKPTGKPGPTATPTAKPKPVPKTGDSASPLVWLGMILLGLAGAAMLAARKSRDR